MGIPSLYKNIIKRYPKVIISKPTNVDYFLMDFNSSIYRVLEKLEVINDTNIINGVIENTALLVREINPRKVLYLALDGSPPRAKMIQQRNRRFKSVLEAKIKNQLRQKHGLPAKNSSWNTSNLTPGTKFMKKLSDKLHSEAKKGIFGKICVIISDTSVPGEGEQKLIPYMMNIRGKYNFCIYGEDGDLIILSLISRKDNITILRDEIDGRKYISIDEYKKSSIEYLGIDTTKYDPHCIFNDYSFLSMICGNDFMKPLPFLAVKNGGFDTVINIYNKLLNDEYMIVMKNGRVKINTHFFKEIIEELCKIEWGSTKRLYQQWSSEPPKYDNEYETEFDRNWSIMEHTPYSASYHPSHKTFMTQISQINYTENMRSLKNSYYSYYFNINESNMMKYNKMRAVICNNYLKTLIWNARYYFEGGLPPDWSWYYIYRVAPFPSDIKFVLSKITDINTHFKFTLGKPYTPLHQLMLVLPRESKEILPKPYQKLFDGKLSKYYPSDYELDILTGLKWIYTEPILPEINEQEVYDEMKKIKLDKNNSNRNVIVDNPSIINLGKPEKKRIKIIKK